MVNVLRIVIAAEMINKKIIANCLDNQLIVLSHFF